MAKLITSLLLLLIAAAALASAASAYRMEDTCSSEMEEMMPMRHCMEYMRSRMRSPYNRRFREDHLRRCCNELEQFSDECRCDAVSEMMRRMPRYGRQMQEMERMACSLPRMCGMSDDCGCSAYSA